MWQIIDPKGVPLQLTFSSQSAAVDYAYRMSRQYREEGRKEYSFGVREIR